jgi:hypothetical protein
MIGWVPDSFLAAYPDALLDVITRENSRAYLGARLRDSANRPQNLCCLRYLFCGNAYAIIPPDVLQLFGSCQTHAPFA